MIQPKTSSTEPKLGIKVVKTTPEQIKPLDIKQKKYVVARVKGASKQQAALKAGAKNLVAASQYANRMSKNVSVQQAIDNALALHELTPELAVSELKKIVAQDAELGAKRLAIRDVLELHGWRKNERPTVSLTVNNAFFNDSRKISKPN